MAAEALGIQGAEVGGELLAAGSLILLQQRDVGAGLRDELGKGSSSPADSLTAAASSSPVAQNTCSGHSWGTQAETSSGVRYSWARISPASSTPKAKATAVRLWVPS